MASDNSIYYVKKDGKDSFFIVNAIHTHVAKNRNMLPLQTGGYATFLTPDEVVILQSEGFEVNQFEPSEHQNGDGIVNLLLKNGWIAKI